MIGRLLGVEEDVKILIEELKSVKVENRIKMLYVLIKLKEIGSEYRKEVDEILKYF